MSERIDHVAEARELLAANITADDWATGIAVMHMKVAAANVHATLALVEQQRLANIIALVSSAARQMAEGTATLDVYLGLYNEVNDQVREGLGL